MLSLSNAFDKEDLENFEKFLIINLYVEPIDGISH